MIAGQMLQSIHAAKLARCSGDQPARLERCNLVLLALSRSQAYASWKVLDFAMGIAGRDHRVTNALGVCMC